jgi:hypothetical protein
MEPAKRKSKKKKFFFFAGAGQTRWPAIATGVTGWVPSEERDREGAGCRLEPSIEA